jgi:hypothetical protein
LVPSFLLPNFLNLNYVTDIWIVGDSIVHWAGEQFHKRKHSQFSNKQIDWDGKRGLRVEGLHPILQLGFIQGKAPSIIIIHVGGNNIYNTNQNKIIRILKKEIAYLFRNFEKSLILWTFILPRLSYSFGHQINDQRTMNEKRKRINKALLSYVLSFPNGRALNIKSIDETEGFFHTDKVHLSLVGVEMYIDAISEAITQFLGSNTDKYLKY